MIVTKPSTVRQMFFAALGVVFPIASASAEVPPRTVAGQTLVISDDFLDMGDVYYVQPGEDMQLVATSVAPLKRTGAVCNRVVGFIVAPIDFEPDEAPIIAGAFRIPVASLKTGIRRDDETLHGESLFDLANHPELTFEITGVDKVKSIGGDDDPARYALEITGDFTIRGVTKKVTFAAEVLPVPFTFASFARGVGDHLQLTFDLDIKLEDFGMKHPQPNMSVVMADTIHLDVYLLLGTVTPEKSIDPTIDTAHHNKRLHFLTLVRDLGQRDEGYAFARSYAKDIWDDAKNLDALSRVLVTEDGIDRPDLSFAMELSTRANEVANGKDARVLHGLARVHDRMDNLKSALDWQTKAAAAINDDTDPQISRRIRGALEAFEKRAVAAGLIEAPKDDAETVKDAAAETVGKN